MHPDKQNNRMSNDESGHSSPLSPTNQQQSNESNNPRKDHYSYSYTYKTADPESGIPGLSSVEVNESVTEEIGPDGSKIIRRHQQEKQINKITQVVTQRVIKRQYIDPATGQIIEYDPNNELFANLPPETVFEEHTVISDDNGGNGAPIVTTTTTSKTIPTTPNNTAAKWTTDSLQTNLNSLTINERDYVDNFDKYASTLNSIQQHKSQSSTNTANATTASFRIKSHPEDNQGYPEERNMDYDPDDINCYPDDDLPYEGLIQTTSNKNKNGKLGHLDSIRNSGGALGRSSASGASSSSSSSPVLFGDNSSMGIDMPLVSNNGLNGNNQYQQVNQYNKNQKIANNNYQHYINSNRPMQQSKQNDANSATYSTVVLPSSNMFGTANARQSTTSSTGNNALIYQQNKQLQQQQQYYSTNKYDQSNTYVTKQQLNQQQPSFNNNQEYG